MYKYFFGYRDEKYIQRIEEELEKFTKANNL